LQATLLVWLAIALAIISSARNAKLASLLQSRSGDAAAAAVAEVAEVGMLQVAASFVGV
jgi:hypothetical protein